MRFVNGPPSVAWRVFRHAYVARQQHPDDREYDHDSNQEEGFS
jgi:hypothetical protein